MIGAAPSTPPAADAPSGLDPLLIGAADAARLCGVSAKTWRRWDVAGRVPQAVRIGRAVRWRREELERWIAADCPSRREWESDRKAGLID